jgi:leader peptidase (prepilin peptidase)/N-methyltransferase
MSNMIVSVLVALGLLFGSFVNATVWRLHEQAKTKAKKSSKRDLSIMTGRSLCTHCGHQLSGWDLVPVVSYLALRGRCRYCRKPIEDTPLAELLTPALFVVSYLWWPFNLHGSPGTAARALFVVWLAVLVCFVILALYDFKWFLLPDRVVFPVIGLAGVALLIRTVWLNQEGVALIQAFWGVVLIAGLFYGLHVVSKGRWIGFGDVKLGIALGLLVGGPFPALLLIFLASFLGSLAAIPLLLQRKPVARARVPFGPFLILATVIVVLLGQAIISWYMSLLAPSVTL